MAERPKFSFERDVSEEPFEGDFRCFSMADFKMQSSSISEIILPSSVLMHLILHSREAVHIFKVTDRKTMRYIHCYSKEFEADAGRVYLQNWMVDMLSLAKGQLVHIEEVTLNVGTVARIKPETEDFYNLATPKEIVQKSFRDVACLTTGDLIQVFYRDKVYQLRVTETKPDVAILISNGKIRLEITGCSDMSKAISKFSDASMAAFKWIGEHSDIDLICAEEDDLNMYFLWNSARQKNGLASFEVHLELGDRMTWSVKSDCDDQSFLEEAKKLCVNDTNLSIEDLLDCIVTELHKVLTSDNAEKSNDEDEARDDDESRSLSNEEFRWFFHGEYRTVIKRLLSDMKSLNSSEGQFGISGYPRDDNLMIWDIRLFDFGTNNRLSRDMLVYSMKFRREACIYVEVKFLDTYPRTPPFVRVNRPRFKYPTGHVTVGGSIAMEKLTLSGWSPSSDFVGILIQIRSEIMSDPNARLELNRDLEYTEAEAKDAFERMVAKYGWG